MRAGPEGHPVLERIRPALIVDALADRDHDATRDHTRNHLIDARTILLVPGLPRRRSLPGLSLRARAVRIELPLPEIRASCTLQEQLQ